MRNHDGAKQTRHVQAHTQGDARDARVPLRGLRRRLKELRPARHTGSHRLIVAGRIQRECLARRLRKTSATGPHGHESLESASIRACPGRPATGRRESRKCNCRIGERFHRMAVMRFQQQYLAIQSSDRNHMR